MLESHDVVIIGAGHIGLSTSFFLQKNKISHVILEKSKVASTWSSQRWDSFNLVLPNWTLQLPDFSYSGNDPDGFLNLSSTRQYIESFATHFNLPVRTGTEVIRLSRQGEYFMLQTNHGMIQTRSVVIATGAFQKPKVPEQAQAVSSVIKQMHSSLYRNPSQLQPGAVLVVGTGQSGAQIADELHHDGRKVFLSVSRCGGRPRRYRGKDCVWWMQQKGFYDQNASSLLSTQSRLSCNVPLTGQNGGQDINLNAFAEKGIELLGRLSSADNDRLFFTEDLAPNLKFADLEWQRFLLECDRFATDNQLQLAKEPAAFNFKKYTPADHRTEISLKSESITQIIWATGFELSYDWISLPVIDSAGFPIHRLGVTAEAGLFFVGLPWQSRRKSSIFLGSTEDAQSISEEVMKHLFTS